MGQQAPADREWNEQQRHESELERVDRNLIELLQELRVAQTGVQILFAFLLTLPFTQRFGMVSRFQRDTYYVTLLLAAGATILLIAPAAYHRIVFRQHDKRHLVFTSNLLAIAGLTCLALAMCGVVLLITDVLFGGATAAVATGATGLAFALLWYALPLGRRARGGR